MQQFGGKLKVVRIKLIKPRKQQKKTLLDLDIISQFALRLLCSFTANIVFYKQLSCFGCFWVLCRLVATKSVWSCLIANLLGRLPWKQDELFAAIATKVIEFAGLDDKA